MKPPRETTSRTQSNEISVEKCNMVLVLDMPVAFGEVAQKSPSLHRQNPQTKFGGGRLIFN